MKGDFTRFTFNRKKQYNSVRLQQGRVQLDADWNEQIDVQNHLGRTQSEDVIGACGVPRKDGGFEVIPVDSIPQDVELEVSEGGSVVATASADLQISTGRIYVNGILSENIPEPDHLEYTLYSQQPFYPQAPQLTSYSPGLYIIYLDVWERHVTAIEDPEIREIALGGPDTATRMQSVWQVKLFSLEGEPVQPTNCWDIPQSWTAFVNTPKGSMRARTTSSDTQDKPCIVPAAAGYRRLENQLYRVEIHQGGDINEATFKWSRDNGIVATRLLNIDIDNKLLTVADTGKDNVLNFDSGQWIEINDATGILHGNPGTMVRLNRVDSNTLIIEEWPSGATVPDLDTAVVRRWDHKGSTTNPLTGGALPVPTDSNDWIELEDGVEVSFAFAQDATFTTGDYWLVPARVVDAKILWPADGTDNPMFLPPHGIKHHYCRLALAEWDGTSFSNLHDCRAFFPALTEPDLYYISGDGQEAMPKEPLPQPLRVGVSNCNRPVEGAWVKFQVKAGIGKLEPLDATVVLDLAGNPLPGDRLDAFIIPTDSNGEAKCRWYMQDIPPETDQPDQLVQVTLLRSPVDTQDNALDIPLMFGASFGVAWQDRYGGARFPCSRDTTVVPRIPELDAPTVERALDQLRENVALYYVSGDGQEARRGELLPRPLVARVANGDWPYAGAKVRFRVINDGENEYSGEINPVETSSRTADSPTTNTEFYALTDEQGLVYCSWLLEDSDVHSQQVEATLMDASDLHTTWISPSPIRFNANLSIAAEVSYTQKPEPRITSTADTVKDALDELYDTKVNIDGDTMTGPLTIRYNNEELIHNEPATLILQNPRTDGNGQSLLDFRFGEAPDETSLPPIHSRFRVENNNGLLMGTMGAAALHFQTNNLSRATITADGNMGIGTAAPSAGMRLEVAGNCTITGDLVVGGNTTTINTSELVVEDNIIRVNRTEATSSMTAKMGGLEVFRGSGQATAQLIWDETFVNDKNLQRWQIGLANDLHEVAYGPDWITLRRGPGSNADHLHNHSRLYSPGALGSTALTVTEFGDIGIGRPNPDARLHVTPRGREAAAKFDGQVGINNPSPNFTLDVGGIVNASDIYKNGQPFIDSMGIWGVVQTGISYTAGSVGVGTVAPSDNLHVHQETGNSAIRISSGNTGANKSLKFYEGTTLQASIIARGSGIAGGPPNALNIYSAVANAPITLGTASGEKLRIGDDHVVNVNSQLNVGNTIQRRNMYVSGRLYGAATNAAGSGLRIFTGRTPDNTNWIQYSQDGIFVNVDTSAAGFTTTPMYFTSLGGNNNHWTTQGATSIYSPTTTGFRIYIYKPGVTVAQAKAEGWYINWMAVGVDSILIPGPIDIIDGPILGNPALGGVVGPSTPTGVTLSGGTSSTNGPTVSGGG